MGGIDQQIDPGVLNAGDDRLDTGQGSSPSMVERQRAVGPKRCLSHHTHADLKTPGQQSARQGRPLTCSGEQPNMHLAIPRLLHQDGALFQRTGRR